MRIDEAIRELEGYNMETFNTRFITFNQALQLGIEALKFLKRERLNHPAYFPNKLPGETEE